MINYAHAQDIPTNVSYDFEQTIFAKDKDIPSYVNISKSEIFKKGIANDTQQNALKRLLELNEETVAVFVNSSDDVVGGTHDSYKEYYKGIEVEGTKCTIHYDKSGKPMYITGNFKTIQNLDVVATIKEADALQSALKHVNAEKYAWEDADSEYMLKESTKDSKATYLPQGETVVYVKDGIPYFAYKFRIDAISPDNHSLVYVDAHTGNVINIVNCVCNITGIVETKYSGSQTVEMQSYGGGYRLRDYSRGNGIETYNAYFIDYYSTSTSWSDMSTYDRAALDAHWGVEMTYDFYLNKFGRNSYDNQGALLYSLVNRPIENACWNGYYMEYGSIYNNPLVCLDIIAHELTHAVTGCTSQLVYQGESGAINEGMSDIFGACVEKYIKSSNGYKIWQLGEDAFLLRDMSAPACKYYQGTGWIDTSSSIDNGGVHTNSGVLNYWFYLLTHGGGGLNQSGIYINVDSIGFEKMAQICYYMNQNLLSSDADYADACTYSYLAATSLGYDSTILYQLQKAWSIVGVENMTNSIIGPTVPCDYSIYYVSNLPDSCTVTWNWETPYGSSILSGPNEHLFVIDPPSPPVSLFPLLQQNTPSANMCRLIKFGNDYINNKIIATIRRNGTVIATLEKTLNTGIDFLGYYSLPAQYYSGYYYPGVQSSAFDDGDIIYAYKNSTITLTSNFFIGANVTYTGGIPYNWTHSGNTITFKIRYLYPNDPISPESITQNSDNTVINFTCVAEGGCACTKFTVIGMNPPDAPDGELMMSSSRKSENITLQANSDDWHLTIVNSATGTVTYDDHVSGTSLTINTTSWKPGIYVLKAKSNGKTTVQKLSVDKK